MYVVICRSSVHGIFVGVRSQKYFMEVLEVVGIVHLTQGSADCLAPSFCEELNFTSCILFQNSLARCFYSEGFVE